MAMDAFLAIPASAMDPLDPCKRPRMTVGDDELRDLQMPVFDDEASGEEDGVLDDPYMKYCDEAPNTPEDDDGEADADISMEPDDADLFSMEPDTSSYIDNVSVFCNVRCGVDRCVCEWRGVLF
jgi:hypothetical protein